MIGAGVSRWLEATPLPGRLAWPCGLAAVALPTVIRAAVDGVVTGCEFTPYLPFVLIAALLLRWWQAALVTLASVAVLGGVFTGQLQDLACFAWSAAIFLVSSAVMIGLVAMVRSLIAAIRARGAEAASEEIVFSLEKGEVWASWYGDEAPVRLGAHPKVARMMEDFLAQEEVGKRLSGRR